MKYEFVVEVTVQVDTDDDERNEAMCGAAAVEAVRNALTAGEDMGFEHALADEASVGIAEVRLVS